MKTGKYKSIPKSYVDWKENTYGSSIKKHTERKKEFTTVSFSPVKELYVPEDSANRYEEKLGYPGEYPFTRGIQPTMYRG